MSALKNSFQKVRLQKLAPKALVAVLMVSSGLSVSSCTSEEVAASIGVVAIGAGAIAVGIAAGSNGRYECQAGYRQSCTSYDDYHGRHHHDCRSVPDGCMDRVWVPYNRIAKGDDDSALASLEGITPSSVEWAETFGLSYESADRLTTALVNARAGDANALAELGLGHGDLRSLGQMQMPSERGITALARTLNQNPQMTQAMLQTLIAHGAEMRSQLCSQGKPGAPRVLCAD